MDLQALNKYLRSAFPNAGPVENVQQLKGGRSNPNYLLYSGKGRYVLRSQPHGKLLETAHDMGREFRILRALNKIGFPVPLVHHLCKDRSVLGVDFYIMEYMDGEITQSFYLPHLSNDQRKTTFLNMIRVLAQLHCVDHGSMGLQDFGRKGNYFERQYYRWNKAFNASLPEGIPSFERLSDWLGAHLPDSEERTIVHGDYRLDNLVFKPKERSVMAVLDWELSTLGDPLSDLGYFLGILDAPKEFIFSGYGNVDRSVFGVPEEEEMLELYCKLTGRKEIRNWKFYKAFGYFRLSAICAGVQARVIQGNAVDPASKLYGSLTSTLAEIGLKKIEA